MELDPREILTYLKDYGITSVNKDDFKKFMKGTNFTCLLIILLFWFLIHWNKL